MYKIVFMEYSGLCYPKSFLFSLKCLPLALKARNGRKGFHTGRHSQTHLFWIPTLLLTGFPTSSPISSSPSSTGSQCELSNIQIWPHPSPFQSLSVPRPSTTEWYPPSLDEYIVILHPFPSSLPFPLSFRPSLSSFLSSFWPFCFHFNLSLQGS